LKNETDRAVECRSDIRHLQRCAAQQPRTAKTANIFKIPQLTPGI